MTKTTAWLLGSILAVAGLATGFNSLYNDNSSTLKFAFITQSAFDCSQVTDVPQTECEALVALYDSTDGDNWKRNTNWKTNNQACTWHGVNCAGAGVTELYLTYNQLSGPIPSQLTNLSKLETLHLGGNQLSGPIPSELGKLSQLQKLFLYANQLSGPIPSELGKLSQLQRLQLHTNQLSGPIPSELGKLSQLQNIFLYNNQLCGKIPESLANLNSLTQLGIRTNKLLINDYTQIFVNWMSSKGFTFGDQDSQECAPVIPEGPYCIDKYDYQNNDTNPEFAGYTKRQLMAHNDQELGELIEQAEQKGVAPVCPTGKICDLNKDGKIDNNDLVFLEALLRDAKEDDNMLIQLMIQAGLPVNCDAVVKPYCGDNICQASEMNKMGETTCAVDCKVVETGEPQTPTKTTGKDGLDGGKLINNK